MQHAKSLLDRGCNDITSLPRGSRRLAVTRDPKGATKRFGAQEVTAKPRRAGYGGAKAFDFHITSACGLAEDRVGLSDGKVMVIRAMRWLPGETPLKREAKWEIPGELGRSVSMAASPSGRRLALAVDFRLGVVEEQARWETVKLLADEPEDELIRHDFMLRIRKKLPFPARIRRSPHVRVRGYAASVSGEATEHPAARGRKAQEGVAATTAGACSRRCSRPRPASPFRWTQGAVESTLAGMRRTLAVALLSTMTLACNGTDTGLVVDVKTDYLPGYQFSGVRTEVGDVELNQVLAHEDTLASIGDDFLVGRRVADLSGVTPGNAALRVTLVDRNGAVAARTTVLTLRGQQALTVLITSSCHEVSCPQADDDASLTACVGGRCVDPRCSPQNPEYCGTPGCQSDADCGSPVSCGHGLCSDGECLVAPDSSLCGPDEICDAQRGCVFLPGADGGAVVMDAGSGCAATTETSCDDGLDDDCDGRIDCADDDCLGASCDDGTQCTESDACAADGTCTGTAITCADDNPCTDDGCDPGSGCTFSNNTADCDDGFYCDGPDRCTDGSCQGVGPPPCTQFCNDTTDSCDQCLADSDCGSVMHGSWSACSYEGGTCDTTGTQTRSVMTPHCNAGTCVVDTSTEMQSCTRTTDGTMCGTSTYTSWGSCGGYSDGCDQSGTQQRTRTDHTCSAGSCGSTGASETRSCSRTVADGTHCGSDSHHACCSGSCTDLSGNSHCGACRINCSAHGMTCSAVPVVCGGTPGYSCTGCGSNAACRTIYDSRTTCWDGASCGVNSRHCQCQCTCTLCTCSGGCGSGFHCQAGHGYKYCARD